MKCCNTHLLALMGLGAVGGGVGVPLFRLATTMLLLCYWAEALLEHDTITVVVDDFAV